MAQPGAQLETEPGTKVLTISETLILVEQAVRMTQQRDPDYQPTPMLTKAVEYAQRFATNKNKDTVQKIRMLLAGYGLTEVELGIVANLAVETPDEARKLVPTLDDPSRFTEESLDAMLKELATYREFE